jgi:anti-sigma B factor antagonist
LDISVSQHADVNVITMRGQLRLGQAVDSLRDTMQELLDKGSPKIVLSLAEVPMIDSSGIGVIVKGFTSAKQSGGAVKLVGPSKLALQTLKIVGLLSLFEVYDDDQSAVKSFS